LVSKIWVNIKAIWYIFPFWYFVTRKSGNSDLQLDDGCRMLQDAAARGHLDQVVLRLGRVVLVVGDVERVLESYIIDQFYLKDYFSAAIYRQI
jgi:hypothetical protein